jgi:hypothetical protein
MEKIGTNEHDVDIVKLKIAAAQEAATNDYDLQIEKIKENMAYRLKEMEQDLQRFQIESQERTTKFGKIVDSARWVLYGAMALAAYIVASNNERSVKQTEFEHGSRR